jgi:excisionase family DNA binding protein
MDVLDGIIDRPAENLSVEQVQNITGVTRRTVLRWMRAGELPAIKIGRRWITTRQNLRRFSRINGQEGSP